MSQVTSPEVPSGSGLSVRQAINAVLSALTSTNSGPSEPPNPVAGMAWFDTTANDLKIRNASNTAWLLLSEMIGAVEYDRSQSLSSPQKTQAQTNLGLSFTSGSGLYILPGNIQICFGTSVVALSSSAAATIVFPRAFASIPVVLPVNGAWNVAALRASPAIVVTEQLTTSSMQVAFFEGVSINARVTYFAIGVAS